VSLDAVLTAAVLAEVARRVAELRRPELVTQRTVEAVLGMPAVDFLEDARAGAFPSWKIRRLVFAKTIDVVAYVTAHPAKPRRAANVASNNNDAEARAFARVGARRVAR
jgi:hypothetical protein